MSSQEYIKSISEIIPENDLPSLSPIPESQNINISSSSSFINYFSAITWQTWIIIILILAFVGINIFVYLAKGTQETALIFQKIFGPILKFFGYSALETTKQTINTSSTGAKSGIDIASNTAINTIDTIQQNAVGTSTLGPSANIPQGKMSSSSFPQSLNQNVNQNVNVTQNQNLNQEQDSLSRALENAKQSDNVSPDESISSIQSTGKSGWCYIGGEKGVRSCAEIGVNDVCMSGNIFPNQAICMNPNLRA
jgi:hypothetical protein